MTATVHELIIPEWKFLEIVRELLDRPDGVGWASPVMDAPDGRINLNSAMECLRVGFLEGAPVRNGNKQWCGVIAAIIAGRQTHISVCIETDHESGERWLNVLKIEE